MSFSEAVKTCFSKYCCFEGRARRAEYWWWFLFESIVIFVVSFIAGLFLSEDAQQTVTSILSLALLLPSVGVAVRRLHDLGKKGTYYLLVLIPVVGAIILFVWFAKVGQAGENQFGPDPLAE